MSLRATKVRAGGCKLQDSRIDSLPIHARAAEVHSGVCHGTLGELLQGPVHHEGQLQIGLISLPVQRYSWVHFTAGENGDPDADLPGMDKCRRAIALYLARHGCRLPCGRWAHDSELPRGKGMASSTADIVAAVRCLDHLFGLHSAPSLIADLLRQIERSDSVFLDHYTLYLSARQQVVRTFQIAPRFHACYIDEGYTVDTEDMTQTLLAHYARRRSAYAANLDDALAAFEHGDPYAIADCATRSAELAQDALPKHHLDALRARQRHFGADGIVVAHTGSLIGYLFAQAPDSVRLGELSAFFRGLGHQCRFAQTGF